MDNVIYRAQEVGISQIVDGLTLGHLRALVRASDEMGLKDKSLVLVGATEAVTVGSKMAFQPSPRAGWIRVWEGP